MEGGVFHVLIEKEFENLQDLKKRLQKLKH